MANYANKLARDEGGEALQNFPAPLRANQQWNSANAVASSVVGIHPATTELEIGAFGGQGIVIRWIPTTETAAVSPFASIVSSGAGASFDHWVPPSALRRFVVPKETGGAPTGQVGSVNGLYQRVAWVNAGITASSVIASEF